MAPFLFRLHITKKSVWMWYYKGIFFQVCLRHFWYCNYNVLIYVRFVLFFFFFLFFFFVFLATRTRPNKLVHLQLACVCGWAGTGEHVKAFWPGHINSHPEGLQWSQQRSGLCKVGFFCNLLSDIELEMVLRGCCCCFFPPCAYRTGMTKPNKHVK